MKKIAKRFELLECIRKSIQIMCLIMFMTVYSSTVVFSSNTYSQASDNSVIDQTQRKIISGKVTDVNGLSLPGVSVIVNGTTIGTVTNAEGEFSLSIPIDAEMLTFSFLGMKSVEIVIGDRTNFVVVMEEDTIALEEVIAIGYGNVRKKDLTGAVGTVEGARISERKSMQISTALQGAMPGLMVTRSSGQPGATSTIRVRGITTIGDTNPLVLVDGMQVSDVNQVNPEDVESISVLKDAASAAIYGSRAAAGVILITTKRAKSGELELDYSYQYGIEKPTDFPTYAGPELYMTRMNEMQWNTNNNSGIEDPLYAQDHIDNYRALNDENPDRYPITDYYNLTLKNFAPRQSHGLRISVGSKIIKSHTSLAYDEIEGLFFNRNYQRYTARFNNDITISENLSASVDLYAKRTISKRPYNDPISGLHIAAPIYRPEWTNGLVSSGKSGDNFYGVLKHGGFDRSWSDQMGGKLSINYTPFEGFQLSLSVAPQLQNYKSKDFRKKVEYTNWDDPAKIIGFMNTNTRLLDTRTDNQQVTKNLIATYLKSINSHNFNLMAGYEDYTYFNESVSGRSEQMDLSSFPYLNLANKNFMFVSGNAYENAYRSYFGRLMYDYKNKYLLQGNVRYDGSSRFAREYRWGSFPSFSAGWVISEESFMQDISSLSFLKFRASYGNLGNERIGNYPYQSLMSISNVLLQEGNDIVSAQSAYLGSYVIEDISWETTQVIDFGVDAYLFDNKLQFSADYYKKVTKDMLLQLEIPDFIGYDNPDQNTGNMYTNGWDIQLSWRDQIGKLKYSVSGNISDSKSIMGDLGGIQFLGNTVRFEGSEFDEWYGYKSDGLFQTQDEIDNSALLITNTAPGDIKYTDISGPDGVPDGIINSAHDRVLLGGSLPRYLYGGNFYLEYDAFDFSLSFQGVGKQNVRLEDRMIKPFQTGWGNFPMVLEGKYWSHYNTEEENLSAKYPRLFYDSANNYVMSDYWLFNGSYFRIKNISLGYNIPSQIIDKLNLKGIRISATISDLLSIDNYPQGWDPEVSRNGYPIMTSYIFGLSVKF